VGQKRKGESNGQRRGEGSIDIEKEKEGDEINQGDKVDQGNSKEKEKEKEKEGDEINQRDKVDQGNSKENEVMFVGNKKTSPASLKRRSHVVFPSQVEKKRKKLTSQQVVN